MKLSELKTLKTFKVRKEFMGKFHADNHEELKADIIQGLKDANLDPSLLTESDGFFNYENRSWFKPKIPKLTTGTITMRSKDYVFIKEDGTKSYGNELKASDMLIDGFQTDTFDGGKIVYTIIKEG